MRSLSTFAAVIGAIIGLAASQSIDPTSVPIGTRGMEGTNWHEGIAY